MMKNLVVIAFLVCASIFLVGCGKKEVATGTTTDTVAEGEVAVAVDLDATTDLAECLSEKNVKMYGTERCGHCKNQKAMFGDAFAKVMYTDCDQERQTCLDAGVRGFPTWLDGQGNSYPGTQPLARLAEIAGCSREG